MSASKLINYFSSKPVEFGFQISSPLDNITLNVVNKKTDQSDFHTGTGTATQASLDTDQLLSGTRTVPVNSRLSVGLWRD